MPSSWSNGPAAADPDDLRIKTCIRDYGILMQDPSTQTGHVADSAELESARTEIFRDILVRILKASVGQLMRRVPVPVMRQRFAAVQQLSKGVPQTL